MAQSMPIRLRFSLGFLALMVACKTPSETAPFSKHDSAGISIAENVIPRSMKPCVVSKVAAYSLDSGEYELEEIRAAAVSSNGTIVAAARTSVMVIDSAGHVVKRFGRRGEGPGEFRSIFYLWWSADTVIVGDDRRWRVQYFDMKGRYLRGVTRQPIIPNTPVSASLLNDASFLVAEQIGWKNGPHLEQFEVKQLDSQGNISRELGRFPGGSWFQIGPRTGSNFYLNKRFESTTSIAGAGERIAIGDQSRQEILLTDLNGSRTLLRWSFAGDEQNRAVKPEHIKAYAAEEETRRTPESSAEVDLINSDKRPSATEFPAHSRVYVTNSGSVWVRMYRRPGSTEHQYLHFRADGAFDCALTQSSNVAVYQFTDNDMLVVWSDETAVGELQRFTLR